MRVKLTVMGTCDGICFALLFIWLALNIVAGVTFGVREARPGSREHKTLQIVIGVVLGVCGLALKLFWPLRRSWKDRHWGMSGGAEVLVMASDAAEGNTAVKDAEVGPK